MKIGAITEKPVELTEADLDKAQGGMPEGGRGKPSEHQLPVRRFVIDGKCTDGGE